VSWSFVPTNKQGKNATWKSQCYMVLFFVFVFTALYYIVGSKRS
jgi:hypothetical protein